MFIMSDEPAGTEWWRTITAKLAERSLRVVPEYELSLGPDDGISRYVGGLALTHLARGVLISQGDLCGAETRPPARGASFPGERAKKRASKQSHERYAVQLRGIIATTNCTQFSKTRGTHG